MPDQEDAREDAGKDGATATKQDAARAAAPAKKAAGRGTGAKVPGLDLSPDVPVASLTLGQLMDALRAALAGGLAGAGHANSGPTTHTNGGGHADFTKVGRPGEDRLRGHANSGPTTHTNGGGHADFTKVGRPGEDRFAGHANSGPTSHTNQPGHANFTKVGRPGEDRFAGHANSGPTSHTNQPGHANFTKVGRPGEDRFAGHANSGPTSHTNQPGHADFTRVRPGEQVFLPAEEVFTLPDGVSVTLPAGARGSFRAGGTTITR